MRCPSCRGVFNSEGLERLWHLTYLRDRLERWRSEGVLGEEAAEAVLADTDREIATLRGLLVTAPPIVAAAGVATPATAPVVSPVVPAEPDAGQAGAESDEPIGVGAPVGAGAHAATLADGGAVPSGEAG